MVTRGGSCPGQGSGLGSRVGPLDDWMRELISSEITRIILDQTPMIFGTIKEGIMENLDERIGAFHTQVIAMMGAHLVTL